VSRKFVELVFNLDELVSVDWQEHIVRKVIVLAVIRKEDGYHSVCSHHHHHHHCHRHHHHCHRHITLLHCYTVTLLTCVSAIGNAMTLLLITANPIYLSLWRKDLREDKDVMVRHRVPAYVDENLFLSTFSLFSFCT
jgi:hypothetical protein